MRSTDPEEREVRAIHAVADFDGKDILEIGCGDGRLTRRFAESAASVRAMDPNAAAITKARRTLPRRLRGKVRFEVGDVTTDPLPDTTYDMAVLSYSL